MASDTATIRRLLLHQLAALATRHLIMPVLCCRMKMWRMIDPNLTVAISTNQNNNASTILDEILLWKWWRRQRHHNLIDYIHQITCYRFYAINETTCHLC
ncbi:uncharacterized protein LOC134198286 isoform X3 [Corticium candelabrum]|uniref:uncharacterized protein LOC134198286 isoform X3 n=1 Tax=Corticium candelabrum TaxID=121492 RepID=UPI002E256137|nr:uncharacterized protein LOC134198286 isoform X3 [Corticium candelabrum]